MDLTVSSASVSSASACACPSPPVQTPTPAWIAYENVETNGYVRAHVRNGGRTLTLDFVAARDRAVIDSVTIKSKFINGKSGGARGGARARRVEEEETQRISLA